MSADEQGRRRAAVLVMLPEKVRTAVEARDLPGLKAALAELAPREAAFAVQQLQAVNILGGAPQSDEAAALLREWEPLLNDIAAIARGEGERRQLVEKVLAGLEEAGWELARPVALIWAGERDVDRLTGDLEDEEAALVRRVCELLAAG
jgi:hypothetical protein